MRKISISIIFVFITLSVFSQYKYRDANRIGITVGVNQFSLYTNNFQTKAELGWNAGLSMRGNFYNNWDMIYGIQFSGNSFSVSTTRIPLVIEPVNYKLASGQLSLLASYKIIDSHLSIEVGPIIQVNGKLEIDSDKVNNVILGTTLLAKDIQDISKFNVYPMVGITFGMVHFRANILYQYGLNNILGNLNNQNLGYNFKGNAGILNGNLIIYL